MLRIETLRRNRARARGSLIPTKRETHRRVDETITETDVATRNRQESDDFTERNLYRREVVDQTLPQKVKRCLRLTMTQ